MPTKFSRYTVVHSLDGSHRDCANLTQFEVGSHSSKTAKLGKSACTNFVGHTVFVVVE